MVGEVPRRRMSQVEVMEALGRGEPWLRCDAPRCYARATHAVGGGAAALWVLCREHSECACGERVVHREETASQHGPALCHGEPGGEVIRAWVSPDVPDEVAGAAGHDEACTMFERWHGRGLPDDFAERVREVTRAPEVGGADSVTPAEAEAEARHLRGQP